MGPLPAIPIILKYVVGVAPAAITTVGKMFTSKKQREERRALEQAVAADQRATAKAQQAAA